MNVERKGGSARQTKEIYIVQTCISTRLPHTFYSGKGQKQTCFLMVLFPEALQQMLFSKHDKWIKGNKDNSCILPVNNHLFLCPSRASYLAHAWCEGAHLKINKSILLFMHSFTAQRWDGLLCMFAPTNSPFLFLLHCLSPFTFSPLYKQ